MRSFYLIVAIILLAMAIQCIYFAWDNGQVADETFYNGSGYPMVRYNDYRFLGEHPPFIMQLASLPLLLYQPKFPLQEAKRLADPNLFDLSQTGSLFLYKMGNDPYKILFFERCVVIMIAILLGFILVLWAFKLYGVLGAIISLAFFAFCPNIIAHGSLFTTDMGVAAFFFLTVHKLKEFFRLPSVKSLILGGIFAGLALMSKISGLVLFPISICLFTAAYFLRNDIPHFAPTSQKFEQVLIGMAVALSALCLSEKIAAAVLLPLSLLALVCIWKTSKTPQKYNAKWMQAIFLSLWALPCVFVALISLKRHWLLVAALLIWNTITFIMAAAIFRRKEVSSDFSKFANLVKIFSFFWFIAAIVIMVGYTDFLQSFVHLNPFHHYIRTFNIAFTHSLSDHKSCLPGSFVSCDWRYFMSVMAVKTPMVTLILFFIGFVLFWRSLISRFDKFFVLVPPLFFMLVASFLNHINIGLRHVLPVYPFLFLICGSVGLKLTSMSSPVLKKGFALVLFAALLWNVYSTTSVLPHSLSYFNEFVSSMEWGNQITSDSNVNWGQDNKRLVSFLKKSGISSFAGRLRFSNQDEYDYHGVAWRPMTDEELIHPKTGVYAVDVESYLVEQAKPESWLKDKTPNYKIGKNIYLFEI